MYIFFVGFKFNTYECSFIVCKYFNFLQTGLIEASRNSILNEEMVEEELINFFKRYIPYNTCPLAGSCMYMDRAFLQKYMPRVYAYLGEEVIDVASINELAK